MLIALACLAALSAALLPALQRNRPPQADAAQRIDRIDDLLPQTQCGQCGYPGCRPYAAAIAAGERINRCPPGGERTIAALADLLRAPLLPLDAAAPPPRSVAFIREDECIGCTKCLQACPVDAIVGAARLMHTVIAAECTGCDLCVEPCPVDCIELRPVAQLPPSLQAALIASDREERAA